MPHDHPEETHVPRPGTKRAIDARGHVARGSEASVDRSCIVIGARVGLHAAAHPLCGASQTVEIGVAHDGVDDPDPRDEGSVDHLRAGAVLGLRREDESWIARKARMLLVVVMVDPSS